MKNYKIVIFTLLILLAITNCSTMKSWGVNSYDECAKAGFPITYGIPSGCCTKDKCFYAKTEPFPKEVERQEPNEYDVLRGECHQKKLADNLKDITDDVREYMFICCLETVERMRKYGYKKAKIDKNGKAQCADGFHSMVLRCGGSFAWCEPDKKQ